MRTDDASGRPLFGQAVHYADVSQQLTLTLMPSTTIFPCFVRTCRYAGMLLTLYDCA